MSTKFLAKLIGLWVVFVALGIIVNRQATLDAISSVLSNAGLMWVVGVFTLLLGLGIVVAHNRWSGGAAAIIVNLYGWAALLKGLFIVLLPLPMQTGFYQAVHFERFSLAYGLMMLALGGYLISSGFKPETGPLPG